MPKTKTALADPGDCPNCGGQKCMDCRTRTVHDLCQDDCPLCCPNTDGLADPGRWKDGKVPDARKARVRQFESGATRDAEDGKLDFEAFLSPKVLLGYAEYMHEHRKQSDGQLRDGDNWQKGIPRDAYMKSLMRHVMDVWLMHRGWPGEAAIDIDEALCAVIFNAMGYLFNVLEGLE